MSDLAEQLSSHMQTHHPDGADAGGWTVARDDRDGTAVLVWRPASSLLTLPQVRGMQLYRWLHSLRDAGFEAQPRTDMEVFGRPDEESEDGIARWLHITDWAPATARPGRTVSELAEELRDKVGVLPEHTVSLDPATVPLIEGRPVHGLSFRSYKGQLVVTVHWECESGRLPNPPQWVADLARRHAADTPQEPSS
ncbi:hypothetical protein [Streptomyces cadmiisoli]|uniref:hypothetical protein n=1 Tax=Streptomyces cadmiisoli TaxID=2184053 RepID=UPI003D75B5EE